MAEPFCGRGRSLVTVFILFRRINEIPHAGVTIRVAGGALAYDRQAMTDRVPAIKVQLLPKDTDNPGTIFGGVILSHVDLQATTEAAR